MRTVLITGASGALGKQICDDLSNSYNVVGLDSNVSDNCDFNIKKFDLTRDENLDVGDFDYCLHLAALTDQKLCNENPELARKVNIMGTHKMLELCKKRNCKKFVYISTGGVYGFKKPGKKLNEGDIPKPFDVYSSTKYLGELETKKYENIFSIAILRYFFPYGPGINNNLINRLVWNIINSKPILLNNNDEPLINPIFITDLVEATRIVLELNELRGVYNIAGCESKNIKEISSMISKKLNKDVVFNKTGKDAGNLVADIDKLKKEAGFAPKVGLEKGLRLTIDSIKNGS